MADWFKFFNDTLDDPRFQYAIAEHSEVVSVCVLLLSEASKRRSEIIPWQGRDFELFGFSRKLNITAQVLNDCIELLCKIEWVVKDDQSLRIVDWAGRQSEYCQRQSGAKRDGYVYYAMAPGSDEVKIGFSQNPWARIKEFQTARPGTQIVATERGTVATEQLRHNQFKNLRKNPGEWFKFDDPIRSLVADLSSKTPEKPDVATTSFLRSSYVAPERRGEERRLEESINNKCSSVSQTPKTNGVVDFEKFWNAYPRKVAKFDAEHAWAEVSASKHLSAILAALGVQSASEGWTRENGKFIPYPAAWLRDGRWNDSPASYKPQSCF